MLWPVEVSFQCGMRTWSGTYTLYCPWRSLHWLCIPSCWNGALHFSVVPYPLIDWAPFGAFWLPRAFWGPAVIPSAWTHPVVLFSLCWLSLRWGSLPRAALSFHACLVLWRLHNSHPCTTISHIPHYTLLMEFSYMAVYGITTLFSS